MLQAVLRATLRICRGSCSTVAIFDTSPYASRVGPTPISAMAASTAAAPGKRAASSSVSPNKSGAKSARIGSPRSANTSLSRAIDADDFGDEGDLDAEALIEAAQQAEEDTTKLRASQSSSSQHSDIRAPTSSQTSVHASPVSASHKNKLQATAKDTAARPPSLVSTDDGLFAPPANAHMLKHSDPSLEQQTMDPEWYSRLEEEVKSSYFADLKAFLARELAANKTLFPPAHLVHSWSRLTPLRNVKVVVVGQDPYHGPGQACGHSFSVPRGVSVPGSLQNIYKELSQEYGTDFKRPSHGCLDGWAKQGVLLLNACLTVTAHQAGSHHNQGWERFTQQILRTIASDAASGTRPSVKSSTIASMFSKASGPSAAQPAQADEQASSSNTNGPDKTCSSSKGVVFLAWGQPAQKTLAAAGITSKSPNILLLTSPHPSPLSAHRGFLGNGHFKAANEWLESPARYGSGGGIQWGAL